MRNIVTIANYLKHLWKQQLLKEIKDNINKGLSLGNKRFTTQLEALTNLRLTAKKAGLPRKIKGVRLF
jgi:hypothetical protein